jgi:glycosyltransferase involved in cell wall biosynthesis
MEAMAKGVPTIATAVSGTPEALGDAGVLLPDPRVDADATVAALVATLDEWARQPDQREAYGRAHRRGPAHLGDRPRPARSG